MINFRFHIVSITAIFLAFAIGLVLGTNFLSDASKNFLEGQINNLEDRLRDVNATNDDLSAQISSLENEDGQLDEEVGERLFTGLLTGEPVLVIAPQGLAGEPGPVARVTQSLAEADADVVGVWRLTDRLVLDDEDEVAELAAALDVTTTDAAELRQDLSSQLADVLAGAVGAPGSDGDIGNAEEPALLARLVEAGFVDYELPDVSDDDDVVQLPASGLRIAVVTGQVAAVPNDQVLLPMLEALADEGPVPAVVSEVPATTDDEDEGEVAEPLVARIRGNGDLRERLTTVDDMDRVSGRIATVLALQDAAPGDPRIGQYGLRDDAERLLPAPPE